MFSTKVVPVTLPAPFLIVSTPILQLPLFDFESNVPCTPPATFATATLVNLFVHSSVIGAPTVHTTFQPMVPPGVSDVM
jgi:hypothetical protein